MGNGAMAVGPQLPPPSSTLPFRTYSTALTTSVRRGKADIAIALNRGASRQRAGMDCGPQRRSRACSLASDLLRAPLPPSAHPDQLGPPPSGSLAPVGG